ncbi:thiol-disulfide oxidoreductase ResA [Marinicrinis lubricantis]|uniref:Thiol-disulfide oxidoreductase ResA n=1 Tax=Marinicrinis lubricantis TaxID=2086470 RepID=A0ABW1ISS1_9BACL
MKRNRRWIQIVVLSVVLVIGAYTIGSALFRSDSSVKIGSKAPEFKLFGLDQQVHQLADYEGKALVINFWGTFCPPCVNEMPALQKQYDQWKDDNVVVLGINLSESRVTVQSFIDRFAITFPIIIDNDNEIRNKYNVMSYPTTFFVDSSGVIKDKFIGEMKEQDILIRINRLLQ